MTATIGRPLRVREAAVKLNTSVWTVRRLAHDGKIASFWLGGQMRIPAEEVDRLMNTAAVSPSEA